MTKSKVDPKLVGEYLTIKRLTTETYPSGIVSLVSDSFDFWRVLTKILPTLKYDIMARDGKVVIRPDSGDPVKIICGDVGFGDSDAPEYKGAIELLWDTFGGTINEKGFKELDPHIGLIYGDSITPQRMIDILDGLKDKGFASSNVVFGIGSFTYQWATRDTYGFAVKATYGVVNGEGRDIMKDPKTDSGTKKSHCGLLKVVHGPEGKLTTLQGVTESEAQEGLLLPVFSDGNLINEYSLADIRERLS